MYLSHLRSGNMESALEYILGFLTLTILIAAVSFLTLCCSICWIHYDKIRRKNQLVGDYERVGQKKKKRWCCWLCCKRKEVIVVDMEE